MKLQVWAHEPKILKCSVTKVAIIVFSAISRASFNKLISRQSEYSEFHDKGGTIFLVGVQTSTHQVEVTQGQIDAMAENIGAKVVNINTHQITDATRMWDDVVRPQMEIEVTPLQAGAEGNQRRLNGHGLYKLLRSVRKALSDRGLCRFSRHCCAWPRRKTGS